MSIKINKYIENFWSDNNIININYNISSKIDINNIYSNKKVKFKNQNYDLSNLINNNNDNNKEKEIKNIEKNKKIETKNIEKNLKKTKVKETNNLDKNKSKYLNNNQLINNNNQLINNNSYNNIYLNQSNKYKIIDLKSTNNIIKIL